MTYDRRALGLLTVGLLFGLSPIGGFAQTVVEKDAQALFQAADAAGRVGTAAKVKPVDARPANAGEVVVTIILGEGKETQSKPAEAGDWVVRNRCPESGNEQYLVKANRFAERYGAAQSEADSAGWKAFRPLGKPMRFFLVSQEEGAFTFKAPWGEAMFAKPGDAIVQDPTDAKDTYRIAAAAFTCTYEITAAPKRSAA